MPLYYLNRILAGDLESERMTLAVSFIWKRLHLFELTSDEIHVLITATASSSPSAQTQVLGHQPPWRQVGIHSKKNIFLQMLASCICALTHWLPGSHMVKWIFILWFLCNSTKTFLVFLTAVPPWDIMLLSQNNRSGPVLLLRISIQLKTQLSAAENTPGLQPVLQWSCVTARNEERNFDP